MPIALPPAFALLEQQGGEFSINIIIFVLHHFHHFNHCCLQTVKCETMKMSKTTTTITHH